MQRDSPQKNVVKEGRRLSSPAESRPNNIPQDKQDLPKTGERWRRQSPPSGVSPEALPQADRRQLSLPSTMWLGGDNYRCQLRALSAGGVCWSAHGVCGGPLFVWLSIVSHGRRADEPCIGSRPRARMDLDGSWTPKEDVLEGLLSVKSSRGTHLAWT